MLAIAIIIGVVYMALNHADQNTDISKKENVSERDMSTYKENEHLDFELG